MVDEAHLSISLTGRVDIRYKVDCLVGDVAQTVPVPQVSAVLGLALAVLLVHSVNEELLDVLEVLLLLFSLFAY